jgi:hypothetical protein
MNILEQAREWQRVKLQHAANMTGTNEGEQTLADAKKIGALADEIERLQKDKDAYAVHAAAVEKENERLQARVHELEGAIDHEMVITHLGTFGPKDDPKRALLSLMAWADSVGSYFGSKNE